MRQVLAHDVRLAEAARAADRRLAPQPTFRCRREGRRGRSEAAQPARLGQCRSRAPARRIGRREARCGEQRDQTLARTDSTPESWARSAKS